MVARRRQWPYGPTVTPNKTCSANLYRCIKRRVGHSFKRAYGKRNLVPSRKQAAYQSPGIQGSVLSLKRVPRPLHRQDSSCSNRQYPSGIIYKQGRRYEVGSALRPSVDNLDLVYQEPSDSQSPTYPRPRKRGSGQAIQARPDHPNRVVSPSRGLPGYMQPLAPNKLICHEVQQQVASICVTSTGLPGHSSGCTQSAMGGSGCLCLPTNGHLGQSGGAAARQPLQENHSDCSGVAQHSVTDFFMYLFQDRKLQPSTIDGYRSAIADKLGNAPFHIGKDENLTRLLDNFHRDRPKGRRGISSWNLSLVLHQLTKAPFEPLKAFDLQNGLPLGSRVGQT